MYQLSQTVVPTNYNISLEVPKIEPNAPITGKAIIKLDIKEAASTIVMHSCRTTKHISARLTREGVYSKTATDLTFVDDDHFFLTLTFPEEFPAETGYELELTFESTVQKGMAGLYASPRMEDDGTTSYYLASQCEATDARRILPCFDEPIFKATFDLSLTIPANLFAISNMPERSISEVREDGLKETVFETSPAMSTYLLAIVAGEMEFISAEVPREGADVRKKEKAGEVNEPVLVRVFAPKGLLHQAEFALEEATACLSAMQKILRKSFPLPKCDFVPISGFAAGAMENWGLITFRERLLLCDPEITTLQEKRRITTVIAHELAHQEFGNSVTMAWWNELWLNESFATLLENAITDAVRPEMKIWDVFYHETVLAALSFDETPSTHSIKVSVETPDEIDEIFDHISYEKGGSVLNMVLKLVGKKRFFKAISTYLYKRQYGTGTSEDVFEAFDNEFGTEFFGRTIGDILTTWIEKVGAPLVSVAHKKGTTYSLTQARAHHTPAALEKSIAEASKMDTFWSIPLRIQYIDLSTGKMLGKPTTVLFAEHSTTIEAPSTNAVPVILCGSYCRVGYDESTLKNIINNLSALADIDTAALVADAAYLTKMRRIPIKSMIKLAMNAMEVSPSYEVINLGLAALGFLRRSIPMDSEAQIEEAEPLMKKFDIIIKAAVAESAREKLSPSAPLPENFKEALLRANLLHAYKGDVNLYHTMVRRELIGPLKDANCDPVSFKPHFDQFNSDLRGTMLSLVAESVSIGDLSKVSPWAFRDVMVSALRAPACTKVASLPPMILDVIGHIKNKAVLADMLVKALKVDWIKAQDFVFLWGAICRNRKAGGHLVAKEFIMKNWKKVVELLDGGFLLGRVAQGSIDSFTDPTHIKELREFFDSLENNPVKSATERGFEHACAVSEWSDLEMENVVKAVSEVYADVEGLVLSPESEAAFSIPAESHIDEDEPTLVAEENVEEPVAPAEEEKEEEEEVEEMNEPVEEPIVEEEQPKETEPEKEVFQPEEEEEAAEDVVSNIVEDVVEKVEQQELQKEEDEQKQEADKELPPPAPMSPVAEDVLVVSGEEVEVPSAPATPSTERKHRSSKSKSSSKSGKSSKSKSSRHSSKKSKSRR